MYASRSPVVELVTEAVSASYAIVDHDNHMGATHNDIPCGGGTLLNLIVARVCMHACVHTRTHVRARVLELAGTMHPRVYTCGYLLMYRRVCQHAQMSRWLRGWLTNLAPVIVRDDRCMHTAAGLGASGYRAQAERSGSARESGTHHTPHEAAGLHRRAGLRP